MRAIALCVLLFAPACFAQIFTDANFTVEYFPASGFGAIGLAFGPNDRLYFAEKQGRVMVMQRNAGGSYDAPTVFADLVSSVYYQGESGMLGLALDPNFASNRYMYLFYTTTVDQRLVRVQAETSFNVATAAAPVILLSGLPRAATNHKAGDIGFRSGEPDNIYISLGDDANIAQSTNMDVYHGKMLRLNKANGEGLAINPFYQAASGTTSVRSRIWAFGFRNPFRMTFHPGNPVGDAMYFSENGGPGGVTLQDRIGWIRQGGNGNWNSVSSTQGTSSEFYFPPNPSEIAVMERQTSSLIGIDIVQGGVFADPQNPGTDTLFCSNWLSNGGCIWRWQLTGANRNVLTPMAVDNGQPFVRNLFATDLKFGPDGWMYFTQAVNGQSNSSSYRVGRIRTVANVPPVANFATSPNPAQGPAPLNVQFTDASTDVDGTIVGRQWDFGNGQNSAAVNPSMNYATPGVYVVTLTVTDDDTAQHFIQKNVTVLAPPAANFNTTPNPAQGPAPLNVSFTDASTDSDGTIVSRNWSFGNGQNSTATNPSTVYNAPGNYMVTLTVTDNHGLQHMTQKPVTVYFPPVASFTTNPSPAQGPAPLNVQFTDASTDADGAITAWAWDFGNGQNSSAQNPSHNYTASGSYTVTLTVTDNHGLQHMTQRPVDVFFATQLTLDGAISDARALTPVPLAAATELRLYRNDGFTPLPFPGGLGAGQNAIAVPPGGAFNTTISVQLTANGIIVSAGEPGGDGMAEQYIGFPVSPLSPSHAQTLTFNLSNLALGGRVIVAGQPLAVDIGVARTAPNELYAFATGRDYLPASGIPATGVNHRTQSDALGFYYVPILSGNGASEYFFDFVGDTGRSAAVADAFNVFMPASGLMPLFVMLNAQSPPTTRDDLSSIAATPYVDFNTQVQPVLSASCAGCHSATNPRGGLSLAPGNSLGALVNVFSAQQLAMRLVEPGNASASWLFEKINAHQPQTGVRMGQGATLTLPQQALIRDWINQGALPAAAAPAGSDAGNDASGCVVEAATGALALVGLALLALRRRVNRAS